MYNVSKQEIRKLVGKSIYAVRQDGSVVTGKLVQVSKNKLVVAPLKKDKGKLVQTKAILPLVLFDLLAIGTLPYWGGGYGGCCYGGPYYGQGYPAGVYNGFY